MKSNVFASSRAVALAFILILLAFLPFPASGVSHGLETKLLEKQAGKWRVEIHLSKLSIAQYQKQESEWDTVKSLQFQYNYAKHHIWAIESIEVKYKKPGADASFAVDPRYFRAGGNPTALEVNSNDHDLTLSYRTFDPGFGNHVLIGCRWVKGNSTIWMNYAEIASGDGPPVSQTTYFYGLPPCSTKEMATHSALSNSGFLKDGDWELQWKLSQKPVANLYFSRYGRLPKTRKSYNTFAMLAFRYLKSSDPSWSKLSNFSLSETANPFGVRLVGRKNASTLTFYENDPIWGLCECEYKFKYEKRWFETDWTKQKIEGMQGKGFIISSIGKF